RDDTPEGRAALGAARHVLSKVGRPDATALRAADMADTAKVFEKTLFNGDGVVPPDAASDLEARQLVLDVIATLGGAPDRGGKEGVDRTRVEAFFAEAAAYAEWCAKGEASPDVMFLGERTAPAHAAVQAVRAKVDDFFVRCGLAAMEPRAATALNRTEPEFAALAAKDLAQAAADVRAFPLARVEPGRALPLEAGVNPAWTGAIEALRRDAVTPILGEGHATLGEAEWRAPVARFAAYEAWLAAKAGAMVEKLGPARVRAILAGGARKAVEALIAKDEAFAPEAAAIEDLVRLVHFHRDLATLLKNFVSFADFYDPRRPAVFQAGTLFLDARSCELCIRVDDPNAHAAIGTLSRCYLAYCDCRRPGGEAMKIVACFTQGDSDYLMVGRNGIFFDRKGRDWDATIVKIVENPISIRQAFFAPYKKFLRFVEEQVARFAASKAKASDQRLEATATKGADAALDGKPPPKAEPVDVGKMVGIVAALGVGVGALGALFGGFVSGFMDLKPWWAKLVAVAGVVLIISGPSVLIAWLKLRHRTLGPILDACGWAVNGRVAINLPLGTALTDRAALPRGARRVLEDPYADEGAKRRRRAFWLAVVVVAIALGAARWFGAWPFGPPFWRR
ncbi:MAG TPA: phage holin family protein, partial [Anaeromyxobacter sp.]|nr:phage holin family protein [Anaeromyxobacter sp.]